jgi:hypothetical protein
VSREPDWSDRGTRIPSLSRDGVSDRAWSTQGAAGHHPWEVVRSDSTSLGAAARWSLGPVAAVEGAEVVRGRRTGQAVHRDPLVHSVQVVDEGRRCEQAQRLGFAKKPE